VVPPVILCAVIPLVILSLVTCLVKRLVTSLVIPPVKSLVKPFVKPLVKSLVKPLMKSLVEPLVIPLVIRCAVTPPVILLSCHTENLTRGDIFESSFRAQSSKLECLFALKRGKRDVRVLSFEL